MRETRGCPQVCDWRGRMWTSIRHVGQKRISASPSLFVSALRAAETCKSNSQYQTSLPSF